MTRLLTQVAVGLLILFTGLAGCSRSDGVPTYPVAGHVLVNGQPADAALVTLHPAGGDTAAARPTGRAAADGSFTLTTHGDNDGAPAGEYRVTVVWTKAVTRKKAVSDGDDVPVRNLLPPAYAKPETTPLRATVRPGANDPIVIEIKTADR